MIHSCFEARHVLPALWFTGRLVTSATVEQVGQLSTIIRHHTLFGDIIIIIHKGRKLFTKGGAKFAI